MTSTSIEWTRGDDGSSGMVWNFLRGCQRISPGCGTAQAGGCYAERQAIRHAYDEHVTEDGKHVPRGAYHGLVKSTPNGPRWTGDVRVVDELIAAPLTWKKPRRVFVNSMSDLFHDSVPFEVLDKAFAVMAMTPQHTYQILTKRPARMLEYLSGPDTPGRVARATDAIDVRMAVLAMGPEDVRLVDGYPGYFVTDRGRVLSSSGSGLCLQCDGPVEGIATKAYCSAKCRALAYYYRKTGRPRVGDRAPVEMAVDTTGDGYARVQLHRTGGGERGERHLVHRLVLTAFVGAPVSFDMQGCHRDGDRTNNALPNLRWGTQSDNWDDRRRHSEGSTWPLRNVWCGVSVEDQQRADERIPILLQTPAAVRWVSYEPALGPVDFTGWLWGRAAPCAGCPLDADCDCGGRPRRENEGEPALSWIVQGAESGSGARPMSIEWARSTRNQCVDAGVAFFLKQTAVRGRKIPTPKLDGRTWVEMPGGGR